MDLLYSSIHVRYQSKFLYGSILTFLCDYGFRNVMLKFGMFLFKVFIKLCNPMNYTGPPPSTGGLEVKDMDFKKFSLEVGIFFFA